MLAIFDFFWLSKIVNAKCTPSGLISTKVTLFSMDNEAMKGDYNPGIKQGFLSKKSSEVNKISDSQRLPAYQIKQIVKKLLLPHHAMTQHRNGALRNDSLLRPGSHAFGLFDVKTTFGVRNTYCRSISAEIRLC